MTFSFLLNNHNPSLTHRVATPKKVDTMNKSIGVALLAVGIALIVFGISASESFGSETKRFFTGTPTDKSMWLLIGGVAATAVGAVTTLRKA